MEAPEKNYTDYLPKTISPETTRADTLARLRIAAGEATGNLDRFVRRGKPVEAQYYAGVRDGLLRAITMLESE